MCSAVRCMTNSAYAVDCVKHFVTLSMSQRHAEAQSKLACDAYSSEKVYDVGVIARMCEASDCVCVHFMDIDLDAISMTTYEDNSYWEERSGAGGATAPLT
ncbi:hypothetical protein EMWEY_00060290 [Eimeria maxima]|uniref:Uncharacterized protein n=1 Tax=Eimeria maxima TaxID=5804 RepID=U6M879_EIMMA|nr:hypothetical protein EMWEY_00060290 [Eimeria maxima]CDJ60231.1 hypothetical protein EMWEY_00060290 [Eimeria maxima]